VILTLALAFSLTLASKSDSAAAVEIVAGRAEATVKRGYERVWHYRLLMETADTMRDTFKTGLIGLPWTSITTTVGYEEAKELATKPGWAAWLVKELKARNIGPGSKVAVSLTGSFPALNLALLAALQELKVKMVGICSVGASSFGANEPGFTWPELERYLFEEGVLKIGSTAVTFGGTGDRGAEWDEYAQRQALGCVERSGLDLIRPAHLRDAIRKRMALYGDPKDYFCYINVGGSQASLGAGAKLRFTHGGWFYEPLPVKGDPPGVMDYFLEAGTPCLNLLFLDDLNRKENIVK